jgi:two-component system response regulator GlrR
VRQLQNVVRQNVALCRRRSCPSSPGAAVARRRRRPPALVRRGARRTFTRSYLSQILQITGGNVSQAARLAKRNRTDFYKLLA